MKRRRYANSAGPMATALRVVGDERVGVVNAGLLVALCGCTPKVARETLARMAKRGELRRKDWGLYVKS